jgi:hypothetical protein
VKRVWKDSCRNINKSFALVRHRNTSLGDR